MKSVLKILGLILAAGAVIFAVTLGFFQFRISQIQAAGISLNISGKTFMISPTSVDFPQNSWAAFNRILKRQPLADQAKLQAAILQIAANVDQSAQDLNVFVGPSNVISLNTLTHPGIILDQKTALAIVSGNLNHFQNQTTLTLKNSTPSVSLDNAEKTLAEVRGIIQGGAIVLDHSGDKNNISVDQISTWFQSVPDGQTLDLNFDRKKILADISTVSAKYEQQPVELDLQIGADNKVTNFQAPKDGITVDKNAATDAVIALLQSRAISAVGGSPEKSNQIELSDQVVKATVSAQAKAEGINEMLGTATTTFAGSTKNRIHNITLGAAKLNGILVQPGEQFSTVGSIGVVDGDHGFVQELVILGPQTIPEYGGGLCQVSTTLFRAILASGLPVTERQNHSYRVSFYEKDGDGNRIGPGLDATIYDPHPDLKFKNDIAQPVLVTDEIVGKKITFTFYGTADGRTSKIIGPTILKLIQPDQDPNVEVTQNLQAGQTKQTEFAIVGAQTTASYVVTYPDGTVKTQVFNSYYHPVQPKLEVGAAPATPAPPAGQ